MLRIKAFIQSRLLKKDEFETSDEFNLRRDSFYFNFLEENGALSKDESFLDEVDEKAKILAMQDYNEFILQESIELSEDDQKKLELLHMYIMPPLEWNFFAYDAEEGTVELDKPRQRIYKFDRELAKQLKNTSDQVKWRYHYYSTNQDPLNFLVVIELDFSDGKKEHLLDRYRVFNDKADEVLEKGVNIICDFDRIAVKDRVKSMPLLDMVVEYTYLKNERLVEEIDHSLQGFYTKELKRRMRELSNKEFELYHENAMCFDEDIQNIISSIVFDS